MFPFEFVVFGVPISLQTNNRTLLQAWKTQVRQTAIALLPISVIPTCDPVQVEIAYYYKSGFIDIDNLAKPILDALNLLIYIDDKQITDLLIRKRAIDSQSTIQNNSSIIIQNLQQNKPFVLIKIDSYYF